MPSTMILAESKTVYLRRFRSARARHVFLDSRKFAIAISRRTRCNDATRTSHQERVSIQLRQVWHMVTRILRAGQEALQGESETSAFFAYRKQQSDWIRLLTAQVIFVAGYGKHLTTDSTPRQTTLCSVIWNSSIDAHNKQVHYFSASRQENMKTSMTFIRMSELTGEHRSPAKKGRVTSPRLHIAGWSKQLAFGSSRPGGVFKAMGSYWAYLLHSIGA